MLEFGNERLTAGVKHLLEHAKDCIVYDRNTIAQTMDLIKQDKLDRKDFTKGIIKEVYKRLDAIDYWVNIPLPMEGKGRSKTRSLKEFIS